MADQAFSIEEFPAWLREQQDATAKKVARFLFDVTGLVQKQAIRNIARTFGDNPQTPRAGASGNATGSGRGLANSVMREFHPEQGYVSVSAGGTTAPYAAIQEFGGEVRPRTANWLTIPNVWDDPSLAGRRAAEFGDLQFVRLNADTAALLDPDADVPFREAVKFWLKKSVTLPPRPYMQPAVDAVMSSRAIEDLSMRYFGFAFAQGGFYDQGVVGSGGGSIST